MPSTINPIDTDHSEVVHQPSGSGNNGAPAPSNPSASNSPASTRSTPAAARDRNHRFLLRERPTGRIDADTFQAGVP